MIKISKKYIFSRMPLWGILTACLTGLMLLITFILFYILYQNNYESTMRHAMENESDELDLKLSEIENYLNQLSEYCIQPCLDEKYYSIIASVQPLNSEEIDYIAEKTDNIYYFKNDVKYYNIMLLNHDIYCERNNEQKRSRTGVLDSDTFRESDIYANCVANPFNAMVMSSDDDSMLFEFYHLILSFPKQVSACVEIKVDKTLIPLITRGIKNESQLFLMYNNNGELICINNENESENISSDEEIFNKLSKLSNTGIGTTVNYSGEIYLLCSASNSDYGIYLASMMPLSVIMSDLRQSLNIAVIEVVTGFVLTCFIAVMLIRYFTTPITIIAERQKAVGRGDFSKIKVYERSKEITLLTNSFNEMTSEIDRLIDENYVSRLNEKSAMLSALEAQVNPHFLYNTLQAIGSMALMQDSNDIYNMLTSLALNLRYSIKASNLVKFSEELKYTERYLELMKLRFVNRLSVNYNIEENTMKMEIPKISLQTLVENSLVHGMKGDISKIDLQINAKNDGNMLVVEVLDNGVGISGDKLEKIYSGFRRQTLSDSGESIGLANLYNRLRILYDEDATITIETKTGEGSYTRIKLIMPHRI